MCGELKWAGRVVLTVVAMVLAVAGVACAKVIYVDDDAPPGGDGSSWETAYTFLQDALTEAETTEETVEIRIAEGTYRPDRDAANPGGTGDREASFELPSGLTLAGGYAGVGATEPNARDWEAHLTILTGDLLGDDAMQVDPCDFRDDVTREENSLNVVTARALVTLEGVVVTDGHAMPYKCSGRNCPDVVPAPGFCGGGVLVEADDVTLRHCRFERNFADMMGGGVFVYKVGNIIVQACAFFENGAGHGGAQGGGLHARESSVTIRESRFFDNWTQYEGAGFYCWDCELVVSGCTFQRNRADWAGGAFSMRGGTAFISIIACSATHRGGGGYFSDVETSLSTCTFVSNKAKVGGAIRIAGSHSFLSECLFCGNEAGGYGGALTASQWAFVDVRNCTFVNNRAVEGAFLAANHSIPFQTFTPMLVSNCIVRNGGQEIFNNMSNVTIAYSAMKRDSETIYDPANTLVWGDGNLEGDPCLVDPGYWDANGTPDDPNDDLFVEGDYHLRSQAGRWDPVSGTWIQDAVTSPCIDAGDPNSPIGYEPFPNGGRINMGAYGGTAKASKSYFGQPLCETPIAGDINGDCRVDFKDVAILLNHWLQSGERAEE